MLIDTLQRKLARTLTNLAPALSTWAEGDFSRDIQLGKTNRELHDIEASLNRLRAYLVDLVGTIRLNAEQVAGSSRTLAELSNDLHSGAEHQAGDTALIRDSLGELEATIQQVAGDLFGVEANGPDQVHEVCAQAIERCFDVVQFTVGFTQLNVCLLYTSPSPRDRQKSRMPSSA